MGVDARMTVRLSKPISDRDIAAASGDLVERFGTEPFFLDPTAKYGTRQHALSRHEHGDGLEVNLSWRYYGPGYERGDPWMYMGIAAYLERRLDEYGPTVLYGGDSRETLEPFGAIERALLWEHFVAHGHTPYHAGFGSDRPGRSKTCEFCADRPLLNFGGGADREFLSCLGCGQKWTYYPASDRLEPREDRP